jgi:hypothetical protein
LAGFREVEAGANSAFHRIQLKLKAFMKFFRGCGLNNALGNNKRGKISSGRT